MDESLPFVFNIFLANLMLVLFNMAYIYEKIHVTLRWKRGKKPL